jgi:chromosome segregation ATPase
MIYDCTNDNKDKNYLNYFDVNFPGNEFKYINKTLTTSGGLNGPKFSYEISDIPLGPMTGKFEFSNENIRAGAGVGIGKAGYAGGFVDYNFETGQIGVGAEVEAFNCLSAEGIAHYNWDDDKLDIKISAGLFDQKVDLVHFEVKDVAQNTIGKGIDNIRHGVDDFIKHVSPEERAKKRFVEDLKNDVDKVNDIHGLRDVINKVGENELAIKGNEALYQCHRAELKYLDVLDERVTQNTRDIQRHEYILGQHEERLNKHDEILANHEDRLNHHDHVLAVHSAILQNHEQRLNRYGVILNKHERRLNEHDRILAVHSAILSRHENRLNRHEAILNIHENRLNEHDRILSVHSSILRDHDAKLNMHATAINELYNITNKHSEILNAHGVKINELDERMFNAENNIVILGKEIDVHAKILSNHDEILKNHDENIQDLYQITNNQQIQLKIHNDIINDHQISIVKLIYGYNDLKERIENDEKIINDLGDTISKVINYSVDTRDIVDGLSYQTQIHKDLIVQNQNDINNIYKELDKQWDFIITQNNILKEIINEVNYQRNILQLHDKQIQELQKFVKNIAVDIKNIYGILHNFDQRLNKVEKDIENMRLAYELDKINNNINNKVEKLIDKVNKFDNNQFVDFIKCVYIALSTGNYNLSKIEEIVNNILILKL